VEYIDIYDCDENHLGTKEKDQAHLDGDWHKAFHCWIIRPNGKILLQLRCKDKSTHPNLLDISAAGHLSAGETPEDGIREIEEELGIKISQEQLTFIGKNKSARTIPTKKGDFHNREICYTYFLKDETPLTEYKLQAEEVAGVYEIDIKEAMPFFNEETDTIKIKGITLTDGKNIEETLTVDINRFIPRNKHSWLRVLIQAERYINGEKYLAI